MSRDLRLSSVTVNCPDADALAGFYATITGGEITFTHPAWATLATSGGRIDFQTVHDFQPVSWPEQSGLVHLDFLVDDLDASAARVEAAGAVRMEAQPNVDHCLVFADPAGNPFCLTTVDELD